MPSFPDEDEEAVDIVCILGKRNMLCCLESWVAYVALSELVTSCSWCDYGYIGPNQSRCKLGGVCLTTVLAYEG